MTSTHEKEMEIVLKQANEIILKQKDEISKAKEGKDLKEKIKTIEKEHLSERKASQKEFEMYKQSMAEKEARLEQ